MSASQAPPGMGDGDSGAKGRFAVPPACPRCDLTKQQMTRTIQNYQKAYRKKVEGLKVELTSSRAEAKALKAQVDRLKSPTRLHVPSLAVGAAVAAIATKIVSLLRRRGGKAEAAAPGAAAAAAAPQAAPAAAQPAAPAAPQVDTPQPSESPAPSTAASDEAEP